MNIIEARTYDIDGNLIEVLTGRDARAIAEVPNLIEALTEARDLLHHTKCHHEDALKCPACSLESRIDDLLKHIEG